MKVNFARYNASLMSRCSDRQLTCASIALSSALPNSDAISIDDMLDKSDPSATAVNADTAIGAGALFRGQNDVKHGFAGMLLGAVALHGLFQLLEACRRVLRIDFGTQCRDLMLQIVRKPAQRFDAFLLRLQIFLMLAFPAAR